MNLDEVSRGEKEWRAVIKSILVTVYKFNCNTNKMVQRKDVTHEALNENCPKCGQPLSIRLGKRGRFIGCTAYPDCDYTRNLNDDADSAAQDAEIIEGRTCPDCQSLLQVKQGKYGRFIGCSNYPKCKFIEPLEKPENTDVECPECHQGHLLKRKSRQGKIFFSCDRYPTCKYALWYMPLAEPCPLCQWPITAIKTTKRKGTERVCPQKNCQFAEPYDEMASAENES